MEPMGRLCFITQPYSGPYIKGFFLRLLAKLFIRAYSEVSRTSYGFIRIVYGAILNPKP